MLEHALAYAAQGLRVMPLHNIEGGICTCRPSKTRPKAGAECISPGKHPRIKTGRAFEAATTDAVEIRKWWSKWPRANIGIATGQQSRVCVVDIDSAEGASLLKSIADANGGLPPTRISLSGRGGVGAHLWFRCDEPSPSNSGHGLDIRGNGGNLVAPPSSHISGRPYTWVDENTPLAPMPPWLLHWFNNRESQNKSPKAVPSNSVLPEHLRGRFSTGLTNRATTFEETPIADIEAALEAIPNDNRSWDSWNRIGMAVWRASGGSDAGMDAFDYWSQLSSKYDPEAAGERWRAYSGSPPDSIGFGSLYYEARQANPNWQMPSMRRAEVVPAEMQAFSTPFPNQSLNDRTQTNGHAFTPLNSPAPQAFVQKSPDNPLIELNEKYSVIGDMGGKCLVLGWIQSKVDKNVKVPSFQTFKSFSERFSARYIQVQTAKANGDIIEEAKQLGAYWLKWTGRKSFEAIDLVPNAPPVLEGNVLNLWSGLAVQPAPGDWSKMQRHIYEILADGDQASAEYILKFAAWSLQNPGKRAEAALVFRGDKGSGKSTFANALKTVFGQHGLQVFSSKHMIGNFNSHLRNCLLLFADEAFWAGDKQGESTLKGLITEPTLIIEQKGVDATPWTNRLKIIMAANAEWVVPAGPMERRYAVFNVSPKQIGNYAYFDNLYTEMANGGMAAMVHALMTLDLKKWHPRQIVKTAGLGEQKERSLSVLQEWYEGVLQDGKVPGSGIDPQKAPASAIMHAAVQDVPKMRDISTTALGRFLRSQGCIKLHEAHGNAWKFPELAEARRRWERAFGGEWRWQESLAEWRGRAN